MPTCLASSSGLLRSSAQHHSLHILSLSRNASREARRCRPGRSPVNTRCASTLPAKVEEQRAQVLTVLHKTTSLLPRILSHEKSSAGGLPSRESLPFWEDVLGKVYEDLTLTSEKREKDVVRVVVYGSYQASGAHELVTALLEDPFASEEQRQALRARWQSLPEGSRSVKLRYGASVASDGDEVVYVQSSWLQQFGVPVEITEFNTSSSLPQSDPQTSKTLFTADVPIILCNPITTALSTTLSPSATPTLPLSREGAILALLSSSPARPTTATHGSQFNTLAGHDTLRITFVDPQRALHGLDTLATGASSPMSVQRYQDGMSGSNVSSVTHFVKDILSSVSASEGNFPPSARVATIHAQTGRALIRDVLAACRGVLAKAGGEADAVLTGTSTLRSQMEEAKAKVHLEVFGSESTGGDEIAKAVAHAKAAVEVTMDALPWYKLFWRVDDVREVVTGAVERAWCRDLERKLVFHAGRLAALQTTFTCSATALAKSFPPSSAYHSPVLHNTIAQLASAPSFPLHPSALTAPLHARQAQLAHPTARLHAAAQRAVLGASGSAFGGAALAWAGWAHDLQLLGGIVDVGMGTETALGAGLLAAAVGVRWAVGGWERAKRRWWRDWDRVGEGLERDLKVTLTRTMDGRVVRASEVACDELEGMVARRKAEVADLVEEVQLLEAECP